MPPMLKYSIVHNFLNSPPTSIKLVSQFMVCKVLYFEAQYALRLRSPLIHVYSPMAGADSPKGHNFDVNRKALSLYPFTASFKEISLKSDFIQSFS